MDKLLSDEELREKVVKAILSDPHIHIGGHYPDGTPIDEESAVYDILDLINTQKRLYAESVIGEDEEYLEESDENYMQEVSEFVERGNAVRAEQRARINL